MSRDTQYARRIVFVGVCAVTLQDAGFESTKEREINTSLFQKHLMPHITSTVSTLVRARRFSMAA